MKVLYKYRYLILRRLVQFSVLFLFAGSNYFGWLVLKGNLSSAVVLGEVKLSDPFAVVQILATGFWVGTDVLISALIVLAFYTIVSGRMFCSWVCPMNPVTDFVRWVRNKINYNKNTISINKNIRYWILALSLILSAITGIAAFEAVSPIGFLHREIIFGIGVGWAVVLMVVFFDFGIVKNGWCGHLCPLGAFYSLVGKVGVIKVKHIKDKCTNCNECFKVCPEVQVLEIVGKENGFIRSGECTNCARCIEVCEDDALKYSIRILK
ncbi:MAG: quinol dehydrogenase ferredoxin subunit NapH [Bacteroidota bacterium]